MQHDYFSSFTRPIKSLIYDVAVPVVDTTIPYLLFFHNVVVVAFQNDKEFDESACGTCYVAERAARLFLLIQQILFSLFGVLQTEFLALN